MDHRVLELAPLGDFRILSSFTRETSGLCGCKNKNKNCIYAKELLEKKNRPFLFLELLLEIY
jgi:hypothetical protein